MTREQERTKQSFSLWEGASNRLLNVISVSNHMPFTSGMNKDQSALFDRPTDKRLEPKKSVHHNSQQQGSHQTNVVRLGVTYDTGERHRASKCLYIINIQIVIIFFNCSVLLKVLLLFGFFLDHSSRSVSVNDFHFIFIFFLTFFICSLQPIQERFRFVVDLLRDVLRDKFL